MVPRSIENDLSDDSNKSEDEEVNDSEAQRVMREKEKSNEIYIKDESINCKFYFRS